MRWMFTHSAEQVNRQEGQCAFKRSRSRTMQSICFVQRFEVWDDVILKLATTPIGFAKEGDKAPLKATFVFLSLANANRTSATTRTTAIRIARCAGCKIPRPCPLGPREPSGPS